MVEIHEEDKDSEDNSHIVGVDKGISDKGETQDVQPSIFRKTLDTPRMKEMNDDSTIPNAEPGVTSMDTSKRTPEMDKEFSKSSGKH